MRKCGFILGRDKKKEKKKKGRLRVKNVNEREMPLTPTTTTIKNDDTNNNFWIKYRFVIGCSLCIAVRRLLHDFTMETLLLFIHYSYYGVAAAADVSRVPPIHLSLPISPAFLCLCSKAKRV